MGLRNERSGAASRDNGAGAVGLNARSHPQDKRSKKVFSFWSAVKFTFVLSMLLWWLPIFGQMIAGFVGGRKAGSPNKGMLAALIPVGLIMLIIYFGRQGVIPEIGFLDVETSTLIAAFGSDIPQLTVYMEAVVQYMQSFFYAIESTTSLSLNSYIITVAFAYVGGILAEQTRREMDFMVRLGNPRTRPSEDMPRSWKAANEQRSLCFECFDDCMAVRAKGMHVGDEESSGARGDSSRDHSEDFFPGNKRDLTKNEQVFSALLQRAEIYDPEKERSRYRHMNEDADFI
ncbi:MAG: hypothetical protein AB7E27_02165 [Candidatus Methanomethylophilaceae archaeon]